METVAADFDGAWKYALEQYFPEFLALFFPQIYTEVDWQKPWHFLDSELLPLAPADHTGKPRVDRLASVQRLDGLAALVLIHLEVQSQYDPDFDKRLFLYHVRIFDTHDCPVISLAILGDEDPRWCPQHFSYGLWGCEIHFTFPMVKLLDLDESALEQSRNPFAFLVLVHRDAQATRGQPEERLRRKLSRYRACLRQGHASEDLRKLLQLSEYVLRLSGDMTQHVYQAMRQVEREETGMDTVVTSFEALGHARGLIEGRLEGLMEGRLEGQTEERYNLLIRQLNRKFGSLAPELHERIGRLPAEQLLTLSEALLDFTTCDDLAQWLDQGT